jgi:GNAT superfamily N-acetyltransferase
LEAKVQSGDPPNPFTVSDTSTEKEVNLIRERLEDYSREQTHGEYDEPGIEISLVLKDLEGHIVGGINASTMLRVMHLEVLWVAEEHRKRGYGRELVLAAERIGFEKGCITAQTWSLSLHTPFHSKTPSSFGNWGMRCLGFLMDTPIPSRSTT